MHALVIGLGKIGLAVANALAVAGISVTGVSRTAKLGLHQTIHHLQIDARYLTTAQLGAASKQITHIVIIVSPSARGEAGYYDSYYAVSEAVIKLSQALPALQRVVFISSTGVYGQDQGEIIDITSTIMPPVQATSQVLVATEQLLQHHFTNRCVIIRPSGIYGRERLHLVKVATAMATEQTPMSEWPTNRWTNRIFDSDLVTVIKQVVTMAKPLPIYLATDAAPVSLYTVLTTIAELQGLTLSLPNTAPQQGKRLIGNLPKTWLQYPTWQDGYQAILKNRRA